KIRQFLNEKSSDLLSETHFLSCLAASKHNYSGRLQNLTRTVAYSQQDIRILLFFISSAIICCLVKNKNILKLF
ncbi:MAG TPA: hypothetical protein PK459_07055, partial [Anaerolineaceae bacterium]|nr:hypothetical protein [Anaerolineaceae bacterium]